MTKPLSISARAVYPQGRGAVRPAFTPHPPAPANAAHARPDAPPFYYDPRDASRYWFRPPDTGESSEVPWRRAFELHAPMTAGVLRHAKSIVRERGGYRALSPRALERELLETLNTIDRVDRLRARLGDNRGDDVADESSGAPCERRPVEDGGQHREALLVGQTAVGGRIYADDAGPGARLARVHQPAPPPRHGRPRPPHVRPVSGGAAL